MPRCRMESTSSSRASRANSRRGWSGLGTMLARLTCCTFSPESGSTERREGVALMSAPRPLPRPDFAIAGSGYRKHPRNANRGFSLGLRLWVAHTFRVLVALFQRDELFLDRRVVRENFAPGKVRDGGTPSPAHETCVLPGESCLLAQAAGDRRRALREGGDSRPRRAGRQPSPMIDSWKLALCWESNAPLAPS